MGHDNSLRAHCANDGALFIQREPVPIIRSIDDGDGRALANLINDCLRLVAFYAKV